MQGLPANLKTDTNSISDCMIVFVVCARMDVCVKFECVYQYVHL